MERRRHRYRNSRQRKAEIAQLELRRELSLYTLNEAAQLRPGFVATVEAARENGPRDDNNDDLFAPDLKHLGHGVYLLPVFTDAFCDALVAELTHFSASIPDLQTGSMNRHSVLLDELGFTPGFLDPFMARYAQPLAAAVYGLEPLSSHRSGGGEVRLR